MIILASSSPRRINFFRHLFDDFKVHPIDYEEDNQKDMSPIELAKHHALMKACDVAKQYDEGIVVGADTFVVRDGEVLGKPKDEEDAKDMLKKQSAKETDIVSGIATIDVSTGKELVRHVVTKTFVKEMTDQETED